jgi:nucleotide-binding universal stress UspA family protein
MTHTSNPYRILVGIDYSTASEGALERALEIATSQPNVELHVVHVVANFDAVPADGATDTPSMDMPSVDPKAYEKLEAYVSVSLGALEKKRNGAAHAAIHVVHHLRLHAPAREIAQLAADLQADLVVVGMCGRGGVTRLLLGSVAEDVARLAPCPVLVFRPKGLPPEYPKIEPPCPRCIEVRIASEGKEYWCGQHRERHGQRHVYRQTDRVSHDMSLPLFVQR